MIIFQEIAVQWRYHVDEFHRIQNGHPFWMPRSYVVGKMLPAVAATGVCCSVLFWIISPAIVNIILPKGTSTYKINKARHQFTNLCFNLIIGLVGVYYHFYVLPTLPSHYFSNVIEKIPDHAHLYILSAMQLGYQLWAIPVGILWVGESTEMIVHHFAVVLASIMSGFSYCGFRYFSVYFYGIMELSSIPLAVMNAFKDNPEWIKEYPLTYLVTRATFSLSFLYIRVYMWFLVGPRFLMHDFFLFWTVDLGVEKIFLLMQFVLGLFLGLLQLYWGALILKGIVAFLLPPRKRTTMENGAPTIKRKNL